MAAADEVEERGRELERAGLPALAQERRHERGLRVGRRLLLPLTVVAGAVLAAEEPEHEQHDGECGQEGERAEHAERAERVRDPVVDPLAVALVLLCVGQLLVDDPVEGRAVLDLHRRGGGERVARIQRPQLDELARGDVDRAQENLRAGERHVPSHPHRMAPRAHDVAGAGHRGGERPETLLPLVAPDLQVDVDDVVVRDRQPREAVADRELAGLVGGLEAPDDPHAAAEVLGPERARRAARLELGRRAGAVRPAVLEHGDVRDALAAPGTGSRGSRT